jgi:hypothetical protein
MGRLVLAAVLSAVALVALPGAIVCDVADEGDPPRASARPTTARAAGLAPHLVIHRKVGTEITRVDDGTLAHPGDIVQVSYVAAGNRHGVVLSVDGAGTVTLHHPKAASDPPALQARGEHPLGHAFELDGAPGFERFFLVTSGDTPTDVDRVLSAARSLAEAGPSVARVDPLSLPPAWRQASVILHKS